MASRRFNIASAGIALVFVAGLCLLLYPWFANAWNERRAADLIGNYGEQVQRQASEQDYSAVFAAADAYNETLVDRGIPDAFAIQTPSDQQNYASQLNVGNDGMMGYISIPRISVNLPIFHGTGSDVLEKGAGHLEGSALPVGGPSTHCVISAHRGLPSAAMFTDLDQLSVGDHFYLTVLDRRLAYEVDGVEEVEPDETRSLAVEEGQDLVTLVTCTPYGVNTHRLLVHGHRVPYDEATEQAEASDATSSIFTRYGLWVAGGLLVVALFALWCWHRSRGHAGGSGGDHGAGRGPAHMAGGTR